MTKDMVLRFKEAKKYQKKALHALVPESMDEHLTIIERELHEIAKELIIDTILEEMKQQTQADHTQGNSDLNTDTKEKSNVKSVKID